MMYLIRDTKDNVYLRKVSNVEDYVMWTADRTQAKRFTLRRDAVLIINKYPNCELIKEDS